MLGALVTLAFFIGIPYLMISESNKRNAKEAEAEKKERRNTTMNSHLPVISPDILPSRQSSWLGQNYPTRFGTSTVLSAPEPESVLAEVMPRGAVDVLKHHAKGQFAQKVASEFAGIATQAILTRPDIKEISFNLRSSGGFRAKGKVRLK